MIIYMAPIQPGWLNHKCILILYKIKYAYHTNICVCIGSLYHYKPEIRYATVISKNFPNFYCSYGIKTFLLCACILDIPYSYLFSFSVNYSLVFITAPTKCSLVICNSENFWCIHACTREYDMSSYTYVTHDTHRQTDKRIRMPTHTLTHSHILTQMHTHRHTHTCAHINMIFKLL